VVPHDEIRLEKQPPKKPLKSEIEFSKLAVDLKQVLLILFQEEGFVKKKHPSCSCQSLLSLSISCWSPLLDLRYLNAKLKIGFHCPYPFTTIISS
jgi:hypothetical protein